AHPQVHVVARRLQPLDVVRGDQELGPELAHQEALRPLDRLHRRPLVRRRQQAGLALHAAQDQAVELDRDHDGRVAAHVLEILVEHLGRQRSEVVFQPLAAVDQHAQGRHAKHVHHRDHHAGQQVPGQLAPPGVPVEREAPGAGDDHRQQQQPQHGARPLPEDRLPGAVAQPVPVRFDQGENAVGGGIEDDERHPEAGFHPAPPGFVAFIGGLAGVSHPRILLSGLRSGPHSSRNPATGPKNPGGGHLPVAGGRPGADAGAQIHRSPHMQRRHDLDWVRILAFAVLVLYHVGMYYVPWDWHVNSPHAAPALEPFMRLSSPWRLSLLFLVSGTATAFLLARFRDRNGSGAGFLGNRSWRLLLPLAFGMLVIVPPQAYYELLVSGYPGGYQDGYLAFWARYLRADGSFCDEDGCVLLPTWNHLWFVAYLWVYTVALWLAARLAPRALPALGGHVGRVP